MVATDTRSRILDAALECFLADGLEQTTIARIRERSAVSNGALFHHFRSKEAIADTLYVDAIRSFQAGLWSIVRARPRSLRAAIHATISHQLSWTEEHPDTARFVYTRGHLDWHSPAGAEVAALNRSIASAFSEWITPLIQRGEVRSMPMVTLTAIVSGPAHAIARRWLAGQVERPPTAFVDELADAAFAGLRGRPVPAAAAVPTGPQVGRIRIELALADGTVLARGEAEAELAAVPAAPPSIVD
jgi:AcrR family transcriptional regulator